MTQKKSSASLASRKPAAPKKSSQELFEEQLLNEAAESRESSLTRLSIPFLKTIKEVVAVRSQYESDKCFARICFKDGKRKSVALDYEVPAEPGDKLRLSTLQWKTFTSDDGTEFRCITGDIQ